MRVDWVRVRFSPVTAVTAVVTALMFAGCGKKPVAPPAQVPEVGVVTVEPKPVPVITDLPGRTSAYLVAQVRARVDGIVQRREFTEGSEVKTGQRLYKIDPAPYEAALAGAKASLAKAQANLASTRAQAERFKVLVASNAISKQEYDNAVAAERQADADVAAGKASVQTATINLGYTDVVSPINGRIGLSVVTPGAYVQANQATLMTTVQQLDPMYVDLTQSSADGLRLRREIQQGRLRTQGSNSAKVQLMLEDGTFYPIEGKLQFADVTVDQSTGSVTLRALFPNPDRVLLPGMFVRARIVEGVNERAIVVPQVGITRDQKGMPTALVVGPDNKVTLRQLVTSQTYGANWIIESGLNPGERVIVQGTEKVRPGATVKPVPAQLPPEMTASPSPGGASAASGAQPAAPGGACQAAESASASAGASAAQ
ncbi:efflux RND transporter periplasmic adaptor subunit [Mycetohabitans endofungorum]